MTFTHYNEPFDHWIMDGFQDEDLARKLSSEFIDFDNKDWYDYDNPLEVKRTLNNWWNFPPTTYRFIEYLNSPMFIHKLTELTGISDLSPDPGLHGAGWHIHKNGGKLNVHLDYSIHPKLELERKLNLIYYLSEDWQPEWGGNLEFWTGTSEKPVEYVKSIQCMFNKVLIFDTTQNSWHGFPDKIKCPENKYRKSIAMYYLIPPQSTAIPSRKRALYSPAADQTSDRTVLDLIEKRVRNA
jgi:Rps23 Pro-64 3,4-dihydroxylase Tpa1-like proline 4-hydroxylase